MRVPAVLRVKRKFENKVLPGSGTDAGPKLLIFGGKKTVRTLPREGAAKIKIKSVLTNSWGLIFMISKQFHFSGATTPTGTTGMAQTGRLTHRCWIFLMFTIPVCLVAVFWSRGAPPKTETKPTGSVQIRKSHIGGLGDRFEPYRWLCGTGGCSCLREIELFGNRTRDRTLTQINATSTDQQLTRTQINTKSLGVLRAPSHRNSRSASLSKIT
jgi:hypothetical protein